MTLSPGLMYAILKLDALHALAVALLVISIIASVLCLFIGADMRDSSKKGSLEYDTGIWLHKNGVRFAIAALVLGVGVTLLPTTREMAAILVVPEIVNSEKVRHASDRLYGLAVEWMDALRPKGASAAGE